MRRRGGGRRNEGKKGRGERERKSTNLHVALALTHQYPSQSPSERYTCPAGASAEAALQTPSATGAHSVCTCMYTER